jgi:hypothetical protein
MESTPSPTFGLPTSPKPGRLSRPVRLRVDIPRSVPQGTYSTGNPSKGLAYKASPRSPRPPTSSPIRKTHARRPTLTVAHRPPTPAAVVAPSPSPSPRRSLRLQAAAVLPPVALKRSPLKRFSALSRLRKRLSGGKTQTATAVPVPAGQQLSESKTSEGSSSSLFHRRMKKKQEKQEEVVTHYQYVTVEHWTDET